MSYTSTRFDDEVVRLLRGGAVGFMPSDTIYGLHARALDREAVEKIHRLKRRDSGKPLIVLISDIEMLDLLSIDKRQTEAVADYWPGAFSLILEAPDSPSWLHKDTHTLAVRLPADESLRQLIRKAGPLVSTSANLQGDTPAQSVIEAQKLFGDKLDFYVDAGPLKAEPSTLAVIEKGHIRIVRPGAVKLSIKGDI